MEQIETILGKLENAVVIYKRTIEEATAITQREVTPGYGLMAKQEEREKLIEEMKEQTGYATVGDWEEELGTLGTLICESKNDSDPDIIEKLKGYEKRVGELKKYSRPN